MTDLSTPPPGPTPAVTTPLHSGPPWLGAPRTRYGIDVEWLAIVLVMLLSGLIFFGWRGVGAAVTTALLALAGHLLLCVLLQTLKFKRSFDPPLHVFVLGLMLGLSLPVALQPSLPVIAGLSLAVAAHLMGRTRSLRLSPVALVLVLMWAMGVVSTGVTDPESRHVPFGPLNAVLKPDRVLLGNIRDAPAAYVRTPWFEARVTELEPHDAQRRPEPAHLILGEKQRILLRPAHLVNMLVSGELIPVEEILLGASPGPVGGTSRALILVIGLYLMYRRMSHWTVALAAIAAAFITLLAMPVVIDGSVRLVGMRLIQMSPGVVVTFLGYVLLASPLLLTVLVLSPMTAPLSGVGRVIYGVLLGAVGVAAMWAFSVPQAVFLGLFAASLLSRALDEFHFTPFTRYG